VAVLPKAAVKGTTKNVSFPWPPLKAALLNFNGRSFYLKIKKDNILRRK